MAQTLQVHHLMLVFALVHFSSASQWLHGASCSQLLLVTLHMQSQIVQVSYQDSLLVQLLAQSVQASSAQWSAVLSLVTSLTRFQHGTYLLQFAQS
jgi:hypothetical protein